jgi:hypothetical protein
LLLLVLKISSRDADVKLCPDMLRLVSEERKSGVAILDRMLGDRTRSVEEEDAVSSSLCFCFFVEEDTDGMLKCDQCCYLLSLSPSAKVGCTSKSKRGKKSDEKR